MKITSKIRNYNGDGGLKAFVDVTLGDAFVVKGLTIREGKNGLFVTMPSKKLSKPYTDKQGNTKEYEDIFFPISKEAREELTKVILDDYNSIGNQYPNEFNQLDDDDLPF